MSTGTFVKVYFLDNSYKTFLVEPETTSEDFAVTVAEKLGFSKPDEDGYWFGFWESKDGNNLDRPLTKTDCPAQIASTWSPDSPSKLVFMVRLFFEAFTTSTEPAVQYWRYVQAVHSVITSNYPVENDMAVKLAALQFRAKFANEMEEFDENFLQNRIVEYIPIDNFELKRPEKWNQEIATVYSDEVSSLSDEEARAEYLSLVEQMDIYGNIMFTVTQNSHPSHNERIKLGVSSKGIQLYDKGSSTPFYTYDLKDLLRWGYVPNSTFYISIKSENGKNYIFATTVGSNICECMTAYAFGWLKHVDILKRRREGTGETKGTREIEGTGETKN
jgi:hypothetical protein